MALGGTTFDGMAHIGAQRRRHRDQVARRKARRQVQAATRVRALGGDDVQDFERPLNALACTGCAARYAFGDTCPICDGDLVDATTVDATAVVPSVAPGRWREMAPMLVLQGLLLAAYGLGWQIWAGF